MFTQYPVRRIRKKAYITLGLVLSSAMSRVIILCFILPGSNVGGEEYGGLLRAELVVDGHAAQLVQAPVQRHHGHPGPQSIKKWFPLVTQ